MSDLEDRIKKAKSAGNWWKPQIDEYIIGKITVIGESEFRGKPNPYLVILDDKTGEEVSVPQNVIIKRYIEEKGVEVGERIAIKYEGDCKDYKLYSIIVDREDEDEDIN